MRRKHLGQDPLARRPDARTNGLPDRLHFGILERLNAFRWSSADSERPEDLTKAIPLGVQIRKRQGLRATPVGVVERPSQEVLHNTQALIKRACVGGTAIGVTTEHGREGLDVPVIKPFTSGEEIVQVELERLPSPVVEPPDGAKIAVERGRLDVETPEPHRPASSNPRREPGVGMHQTGQPFAPFRGRFEGQGKTLVLPASLPLRRRIRRKVAKQTNWTLPD